MDLNTHSSDKNVPNKGKSLRFELELTPNSEGTKEFSYAQLVNGFSEQGNSETPSLDPLADNEEAKLAQIAKRFEEKYGPSKRKRLIHESDLIDRGYGYDPSDSFVDDSELYEDYVPPQLDTKCGGFYINTGVLEFKTLEDVEDEELDFVLKKKLVPKKHTSQHTTHTAGSLAKQKLKMAIAQKSTSCQQRVGSLAQPPVAKQTSLKTKNLGEKKLSKKQLFSSEARATNVPVGVGGIAVSVPLFKVSSSPLSEGGQSVETSTALLEPLPLGLEQEASKSPPLLPSNLPVEIQSKISCLEESIQKEQLGGDGKLSTKARAGYDEQLVDIELACKKISVKERTAVFEYLSSKVGISRQTILKRVKLILRKREGGALEVPLQKLKEAVAASMAPQLAQYEEEVRNRTDLTSVGDKLEQEEESKMDDLFEDTPLNVTPGVDGSKPKRLPRKRYKWTEDVKKLLCEVVRLKVESEEVVNRIRVPNGEDLIMQFLEDKVRPLWPKGWMQKGILYKVSESAHRHFTSPQFKKSVLTSCVKSLPSSTLPSTPLSTPLTTSLSTPLTTSLSTPLTTSLSTPLTTSLSTPLTTSLSTPLTTSLSTPLTTSLSTPLTTSPFTPLTTSPFTTPYSLSVTTTNMSVKKSLIKMERDHARTTPHVTTPHVTTPRSIPSPLQPTIKQRGSGVGSPLGSISLKFGTRVDQAVSTQSSLPVDHTPQSACGPASVTTKVGSSLPSVTQVGLPVTSVTQVGSPLTKVGSPLTQVGSLLTSVTHVGSPLTQVGSPLTQVGSLLTSVTQVGSPLTQVGSPLTQVGSLLTSVTQVGSPLTQHGHVQDPQVSTSVASAGHKGTLGPSNGLSSQTPVLQTLRHSNKAALNSSGAASSISRQSPTTTYALAMLDSSMLSQLALTSMASRHQHTSSVKSAVNSSSVASLGYQLLGPQVSGGVSVGVPFSLSSVLQSAPRASHTTAAQGSIPTEMSSQHRLLTLSRNAGNRQIATVGGKEQPHTTPTVVDRANQPTNVFPTSPSKPAPVSQIISEHSYGGGKVDQ